MGKNKKKKRLAQQLLPKQANNDKLLSVSQAVSYSGPLPPPSMLKQYDDIEPGLAGRIVKMAEQQSGHRRDLEGRVISSDIKNSKLGIISGLVIGIFGITATVVISIFGNQIIAGGIGTISIGSLVGTFIYGTRSRKGERQDRRTEQQERSQK